MRRGRIASRPSKGQVVILCAILVISILGVIGLFVYETQKVQGAQQKLQQEQKTLSDNKELIQQIPVYQQDYIETQAKLKNLEKTLPTRAYIPTLLAQIEALSDNTRCVISSIRPVDMPASTGNTSGSSSGGNSSSSGNEKKVPGVNYDTQKITVEVQGSYLNLAKFVDGLGEFPKIVSIDCINISSASSGEISKTPTAQILTLKLDMTAYVLKEGDAKNAHG